VSKFSPTCISGREQVSFDEMIMLCSRPIHNGRFL